MEQSLNGDFKCFVDFVHILASVLTCMIFLSWLQGELDQSFEGIFLRDFSTVKVQWSSLGYINQFGGDL